MVLASPRCQWCRHWHFSHISDIGMFGNCHRPNQPVPQPTPASHLCDHFATFEGCEHIFVTPETEDGPPP